MNKYKCHKVVEAGKILNIITERTPDGKTIFELATNDGVEKIEKHNSWLNHHKAAIGGYFVRYKDGYESFSPAEAFEEGYVEIG